MSQPEYPIVGIGIDTLKINVKVCGRDGEPLDVQELDEELAVLLQDWQEQAKMESKPVVTTMTFHYARLMMYPNGAPCWKYIVRNDCIELKIAPRLKIPMLAKVTLLSGYLWEGGDIRKVIKEVKGFLCDVFGSSLALQAAQIDLCVDLAGLKLPTEWAEVFITKALSKRTIGESHKDDEYYRGRKLETLLFSGHGCPVSCKIYDKTKEIEQRSPEKRWFYDIWKANGWDGKEPVRRIEYSIERAGLHQAKLEGLEETIENIKRLWAYCSCEWLRMVKPGRTKNRTRWVTHPLWVRVQHAFDRYAGYTVTELGPLVRERRREANIERGVAQIAGMLTTLGAWEHTKLDPENCGDELFSLAYTWVLERWQEKGVNPHTTVQYKKFLYSQKG